MGHLGFYFDMEKCAGCRTCLVACKDRNDLPIGILYRRVRTFETGSYPNAALYHYSSACNHCESPACVANCPTAAMSCADDGTVQHDDGLCIGCETCVKSCPYGVPVLLGDKGVTGKCDACKALRDQGMNPACVDACTMRCLDFGEVEELKAKYGADLVSDLPVLPSSSETRPSILVHAKPCAMEESFVEQPV